MPITRYATIAVPGPLRRTFCYHLPEGMDSLAQGQRVRVPFGRSRKAGFFLGPGEPPKNVEVRDIIEVIDDISYFSSELFRLCTWMADYYFANPADCLTAALPGSIRTRSRTKFVWQQPASELIPDSIRTDARKGRPLSRSVVHDIKRNYRGLLNRLLEAGAITERLSGRIPDRQTIITGYTCDPDQLSPGFFRSKTRPELFEGAKSRAEIKSLGWSDHYIRKAVSRGLLQPVLDDRTGGVLDFVEGRRDVDRLELTAAQREIFETVRKEIGGGFQTFLLHGITGSGKTLVYCHLVREVLERNRTALILTPEISLSGILLAYFRGFFGDLVTVVHSAMTDRERLDSWQGIRSGKYRIVVGPRSALFAPLEEIGLIVVDEEHDSSYKQDDPSPRFHGRDSAIMRARFNNIPVILGTATPSVESYHHAVTGRYRLLTLDERPGEATLPRVHVVDMRTQRIGGDLPFVSLPLKQEVTSKLEQGEQVILYLNRRGYSPFIKCGDCGHVPTCPHCNVKLTYHKSGHKLSCHYCGYVKYNYEVCGECGSAHFLFLGAGTQKVEENIPRLFPAARAMRFDSDTASGRRNAYQLLREFAERKYDLLLGTQMVTKGLDLPGVSLVGVLAADMELDLPDFRAGEKTFARLLQVAGRSGRTHDRGEVLIQTYYPELELIDDAARQDYVSFYNREIALRESFLYPPFVRLVNFVISGKDDKLIEGHAMKFRGALTARAQSAGVKIQVLGPVPCPLSYLKGRFRRHLFAKTRQVQKLVALLSDWETEEPHFRLPSSIKLVVDVDPDNMM
ncbi:MAG: primosomal protein N' [Candidatus Zixiibacteriota bacterium]